MNFNPTLHKAILKSIGSKGKSPSPLEIFDYIYGVLHSPSYRTKFRQALSIDFPYIPYPSSPESFWDVATKGGELRQLHLMKTRLDDSAAYAFRGEGKGEVDNVVRLSDGRVQINVEQWFEGVPEAVWEFQLGGYLPAQKWLKDRKGKLLNFDEIVQYQNVIRVLSETDRIMRTIHLAV